MPRMRVTSTTGYMDDLRGLVRLPAGTVLDVEDDTAKRWTRHNIAEPTDLEAGQVVTDQDAAMSPAQIKDEMERLQKLLDAQGKRRDGALDQERPAGLPADDEHPLARYGLNEAQRTALWRAGFTSADRIDAATDQEILETEGIGEGTLARLRGKR